MARWISAYRENATVKTISDIIESSPRLLSVAQGEQYRLSIWRGLSHHWQSKIAFARRVPGCAFWASHAARKSVCHLHIEADSDSAGFAIKSACRDVGLVSRKMIDGETAGNNRLRRALS